MNDIVKNLREYFDSTPKEKLQKDLEKLEFLNDIGPDAVEYCKEIKSINKE